MLLRRIRGGIAPCTARAVRQMQEAARLAPAAETVTRAHAHAPGELLDDVCDVKMVQVVFRHGDRAPIINAMAGSTAEEEEAATWAAKLPEEDHVLDLASAFPVHASAPHLIPRSDAFPFGRLTRRGLDQMRSLGQRTRDIMDEYGLGPPGRRQVPDWVAVSASNYPRTHTSAQALLAGLLGGDDQGAEPTGAGVRVPAPHAENINAFSSRPGMQKLIDDMTRSSAFEARESQMRPLRQKLEAALPFLSAPGNEFAWMYAADYFTCRSAHALPLAPGLGAEDAATAIGQLQWRFGRWYDSRPVRAHATGPLLTEITHRMNCLLQGRADHRLSLYSGHDVTLLPLLHALSGTADHDWPDYAAHIRFELLQHRRERHQCFVRVWYNDRPLQLTGCAANVCTLYHFAQLVNEERIGRKVK